MSGQIEHVQYYDKFMFVLLVLDSNLTVSNDKKKISQYVVIIISSILVMCTCILIIAHYLWMNKRKSVIRVEKMPVAQQNVQHNNTQLITDVSCNSFESMYTNRNNTVTDYATATTERDCIQKECDGERQEGEADPTDVGDV